MKDQIARDKNREQDDRLASIEALLVAIDERLKKIETSPLYPKGKTNGSTDN